MLLAVLLLIMPVKAQESLSLEPGEQIEAELTGEQLTVTYHFEAESGQIIHLVAYGQYVHTGTMLNPQGVQLDFHDASTMEEPSIYFHRTLLETGPYTFTLTASQPTTYFLQLTLINAATAEIKQLAEPLPPNQPLEHTITDKNYLKRHYVIEAQPGQIISVVVRGKNSHHLRMLFVDQMGNEIASGDTRSLPFTVTDDQTPLYVTVEILPTSAGLPVTYEILWEVRETPLLKYDEWRTDQLDRTIRQLDYQIEGQAGDTLHAMVSTEAFDAVLDLYTGDGTLLFSADDSENDVDPYLSFTLPESGMYRLVLRSFNPDGEGTFILRVAKTPDFPMRWDVRLDRENATERLSFPGDNGDRVMLTIDDPENAGIVTVKQNNSIISTNDPDIYYPIFEGMPLRHTGHYNLDIRLKDEVKSGTIGLKLSLLETNLLTPVPIFVRLTPEKPKRTFNFYGYPQTEAQFVLTQSSYYTDRTPTQIFRVTMTQNSEIFLRYETAELFNVWTEKTELSYLMPSEGMVTVTVELLGDQPVIFELMDKAERQLKK